MKTRSATDGFTLLEVLTALAILSVGLTVLLTGASRALRSVRLAQKQQEAQWTLGMAETQFPLLVTDTPEELAVSGHTFDNGHIFERSIEETEDEELFVVRSTVSWEDRGGMAREEVVRYLLVKPQP
jgi:type II secretion system protein I